MLWLYLSRVWRQKRPEYKLCPWLFFCMITNGFWHTIENILIDLFILFISYWIFDDSNRINFYYQYLSLIDHNKPFHIPYLYTSYLLYFAPICLLRRSMRLLSISLMQLWLSSKWDQESWLPHVSPPADASLSFDLISSWHSWVRATNFASVEITQRRFSCMSTTKLVFRQTWEWDRNLIFYRESFQTSPSSEAPRCSFWLLVAESS